MNELEQLRKDLKGTFIDAFGDSDGADKMFDAIVRATEERIIALIEEHSGCGYEHYEQERCYCDAIALIKGENK